MNNNKHHIDELFKDRLYNHEVPAPADVWGKINNKMQQRQKRLWIGIISGMAATFALILSAGIGYYVGMGKNQKIASQNIQNNEKLKITNSIAPSSFAQEAPAISSSKNYDSAFAQAKHSLSNIHKSSINAKPTNYTNTQSIIEENEENTNYAKNEPVQLTPLTPIKCNLQTLPVQNNIIISTYYIEQYLAMQANNIFLYETENEEKANEPKPFHFEMGGNIAPVYAYRTVNGNSGVLAANNNFNNEKPLLTYSGGLNIQFGRGRWRIETGVNISNLGQKIEQVYLNDLAYADANNKYYYSSINYNRTPADAAIKTALNSNGNILLNSRGQNIIKENTIQYINENSKNNVDNWGEMPIGNNVEESEKKQTTLTQQYHFVEIPFVTHFRLMEQKLNLSISGGLSTSILTGNNLYASINGQKEEIGNMDKITEVCYAGIAGISLEFPLWPRLAFRLEPRFRYYFNPLAQISDISKNPIAFGMYSGISYKF